MIQRFLTPFIIIFISIVVVINIENKLMKEKENFYPPNMNVIEKTEEPEQVIGSLMLGGLRIYVVDLLWLKMLAQEDAGNFNELILTANIITTMQPDYTSVWEYLGYVLANNISSKEQDPQLKLEWVKSAIDYLYKGIKRNPNSGMLYTALGRTINQRLGIFKERNLSNYYSTREEGKNPHEMAREYMMEAVKTRNNQVYAEREFFIVNSYWVREAIFHMRKIVEKQCLWLLALLNKEPVEQIEILHKDYSQYLKKYAQEGDIKEVARRIDSAVKAIQNNILIYPNQADFERTLETHSADYLDRYNMATYLDSCLSENNSYLERKLNDLTEKKRKEIKIKTEIILLRLNILGTEYLDDGGKAAKPWWSEIRNKQNLLKELNKNDGPN